ncbi:diguanylate cyclase domain-containing protein [Actinoplanes sp. CA-030573]|uniref:GGDEF domain-containing protein n=1 Tax=Actinoplanes sp. CA-030573 TaxID=3239898 RepID=UPI003D8D9A03
MQDPSRRAARMLERAQAGEADAVLIEAESLLRLPGGDLACFHFCRVVALIVQGDLRSVLRAVEHMLRAADREGSNGWRAAALSTRASERLRLGEEDIAEYDVDAALRDLTLAERLVSAETDDPIAAVNARVGIAVGYLQLRLYELAGPQYEAAYEISAADPAQNGNRSMWLTNLGEMHLHWALELYQVGRVAEAEQHTARAEWFAVQAAAEASGEEAEAWRDMALLMAACARADRADPAGASVDIEHYTAALQARGVVPSMLAYSQPFRAVALKRSGRLDEALRVMDDAVASLPPDAGWLIAAATHRTRALLIAAGAPASPAPAPSAAAPSSAPRSSAPAPSAAASPSSAPAPSAAAPSSAAPTSSVPSSASDASDGGRSARRIANAEAELAYGDALAGALWRQRQHTLHTAATLKSLEALRTKHEQATRAADLDPLTGIANRRAFDSAVRRAQSLPGAADAPVTVMIIDGDRFKQINDTMGHSAGDTALREMARVLAAELRDQDLIARLGGDEFAALLPDVAPAAAAVVAERMVEAVRHLPDCPTTISIGVASAPAIALDDALRRADQAMYEAKRAGGDAVREHAFLTP